MEAINFNTKTDSRGRLRLDVSTPFPECRVEALVVINPISEEPQRKAKYNFRDLAGKLAWKGDAVVTQRKLRNEW